MPPLDPGLRNTLDKAIVAAREAAERAAETALKALAVDRPLAFSTLTDPQKRLRKALRARARQLGGGATKGDAGFRPLVEEVAYDQWHRMLFACFLAENHLLMHPSGAPVTLGDCAELAAEEGEPDAWQLAARYAAAMLPGIFPVDDPGVHLRFAAEGRTALEGILAGLPSAVFTSDDGLGWVYQFWESRRKKEVSASGRKIEKLDLAAYSQLFTEHYMVRFLLENSLGAWWAGRHPDSPLLEEFTYLRFRDDGAPAADTFPGWPKRAAEITVMDPCCGSGHFLVAAFEMLRRMRVEEEGLGEAEASDAVLRDNLFGLEIDSRCVQIAAFAFALAAWRAGGYRPLPLPNVACSGIPITSQLHEWTRLAGDDVNLKQTLERLHHLFCNAPDLGSLINPADVPVRDRMFTPEFATVGPLLERALAKELAADDPVAAVFGEAARGVARATNLLARQYTLVATNVPFLGSRKQGETLFRYLEGHYPDGRNDLATAFVERSRAFVHRGGTYALVTPQNWLFLGSYQRIRKKLLEQDQWNVVVWLGEHAFESPAAAGAFAALLVLSRAHPSHAVAAVNAREAPSADTKALLLREAPPAFLTQEAQLSNPQARITVTERHSAAPLLETYAAAPQGIKTGDDERWRRYFWELPRVAGGWEFYQSTAETTQLYGGRSLIVDWRRGGTDMVRPRLGNVALGRPGVVVSTVRSLTATLFTGQRYDSAAAVIVPADPRHLAALWVYCSSDEFRVAVRRIDQKVSVTNTTLLKVPFDLSRWVRVAEEQYPEGLPEPYSNDPSQWLFGGNPADSSDPLQVAVARLLGYRSPQQELDHLVRFREPDGILPLVPLQGRELPDERLRSLLAAAFADQWSPALQSQLVHQVGFGGKGLDAWLRDGFFEQHCKLFHQRPFIWHVWDGRRDGFSALVNYHMLDAARLEKLAYTYLGDWIRVQREARDSGAAGADARLVAALDLQKRLAAIREGEPPYDIYVRWKPLHQQPIGWDPDLNDGVRLNIRPFVLAGVLRSRVNVKWNTDRGLNPDGSERINHRHIEIADKHAAREGTGT